MGTRPDHWAGVILRALLPGLPECKAPSISGRLPFPGWAVFRGAGDNALHAPLTGRQAIGGSVGLVFEELGEGVTELAGQRDLGTCKPVAGAGALPSL